ncbi:hypothetical protein ACS0TY_003526 [Phlomoides rotata]
MGIRQEEKESDEDYLDRVDEILLMGDPVGDDLQLHAVLNGQKPDSWIFRNMTKDFPKTYAEFCRRAGELITRQKVLAQRLGGKVEEGKAQASSSEKKKHFPAKKTGGNYKAHGNFQKFERAKGVEVQIVDKLIETPAFVLNAMQHSGKKLLKKPHPIKATQKELDFDRFCHFHDSPGHNTSQCRNLLRQLWKLFEEGKLNEYVCRPPPCQDNHGQNHQQREN